MTMVNRTESTSSYTLQQVANTFRLAGWVTFWAQVVLAVVASVTLLFVFLSLNTTRPAVGTGFGLLFSVIGVGLLAGGIFFAYRYTRLSRQLRLSDATTRPKKSDTIRTLQVGLMFNLIGMLLTFVGAFAITGGLALKSFRTSASGIQVANTTDWITSIDILTVQALFIILLALYAGIVCSLTLLSRISRNKGE
jgi:hypothetical protein